jgi:NADPH:quinone reductase-like Zn-dependent oxidoreductase
MKIIAITSSEEKAKILTNLGADHVVNRNTEPNWPEKILDLTGKEGVDFVVEVAGGRTMREVCSYLLNHWVPPQLLSS